MSLHYIMENLGGLIFYAGFVIFLFDTETGVHSVLIGASMMGMAQHGKNFTEGIVTEIRWIFRKKKRSG